MRFYCIRTTRLNLVYRRTTDGQDSSDNRAVPIIEVYWLSTLALLISSGNKV